MQRRKKVSSTLIIIIVVGILLLAAIAKLFYVALSPNVDGINLKKFAENRNTKIKTLYASRGTIFDNSGEALAISVNSYTLIAYLSDKRTTDVNRPMHVVDKERTAEELSKIIALDKDKILEYLNKDAYQVEFGSAGKGLTEGVKKQIEELELPGIDFIEGSQRYYKMGNFASYIIGYAKTSEDGEINGELGIESYYNDILKGKDGSITYESDIYGYQLPSRPSVTVEAESGSDIYLTIDSNVQIKAENAIKDLESNYKTDWAMMMVMDAKTGAVVASATSPSYNPNDLNTLSSYVNPLVSQTFEPGSTMKTFSWASAIEDGFYDGSATYKSGSIEVADAVISDFNKVGWGVINYDTGYAYSSNVAATKLALELGTKKLSEYYDKFGFGKKTGIELSGELAGDLEFKYKSELATASFGQGITVTPIQLLQGYTAIVNDGIVLKPYIVDKIVDANGKVTYAGQRKEVGRAISSETAKKMQQLMHNVNYEGLAKMWQPKTVSMMIKTGTSQLASPSGGYLEGEHDIIYSLMGIFPEDNPKYIIYVAAQRLIGSQRVIADMVTKTVDDIAAYAKITENQKEDTKSKIFVIDNYKSKKVEEAQNILSDKVKSIVIGKGEYIKSQYPTKGSHIAQNSKVFLITNNNEYEMIDLTGWSISDVRTYCNLTGLKLEYTGYGYVTTQNIAPGTAFKKKDNLIVNLEN